MRWLAYSLAIQIVILAIIVACQVLEVYNLDKEPLFLLLISVSLALLVVTLTGALSDKSKGASPIDTEPAVNSTNTNNETMEDAQSSKRDNLTRPRATAVLSEIQIGFLKIREIVLSSAIVEVIAFAIFTWGILYFTSDHVQQIQERNENEIARLEGLYHQLAMGTNDYPIEFRLSVDCGQNIKPYYAYIPQNWLNSPEAINTKDFNPDYGILLSEDDSDRFVLVSQRLVDRDFLSQMDRFFVNSRMETHELQPVPLQDVFAERKGGLEFEINVETYRNDSSTNESLEFRKRIVLALSMNSELSTDTIQICGEEGG